MQQKRPALLLEILVAFTLLSICIVPLMRGPIEAHQEELDRIYELECERIAAWTFTEIKEKFLKKQIRWDSLPPFPSEGRDIALPEIDLKLPPFRVRAIPRKFAIKTLEQKEEAEGKIHRLLAIRITVGSKTKITKPHEFTYRLAVTKKPSFQ